MYGPSEIELLARSFPAERRRITRAVRPNRRRD